MKSLTRTILLLCVGMFAILSCSKDNDSNEENTTNKSYKKEISFDYSESEKTITLSELSAPINKLQCSDAWVTAEKMPYTSGSPQVSIKVKANTDSNERNSTVTATSYSGDIVKIVVKQSGKDSSGTGGGTGIDDIHNENSNSNAY